MARSVHSGSRAKLRRAAGLALAAATAAASLTGGIANASTATASPGTANSATANTATAPDTASIDAGGHAVNANGVKAGWAMTANGTLAPVDTTFLPTPVHPEALTHPTADFMGSSDPARAAATSTAPTPTAQTPANSPQLRAAVTQLPGIDVSSYQGTINWATVSKSIDFSYAKASEGTYYTNADFANQYNGPYSYGVIRGAYHFGIPSNSSGQAQADYFINHGGGWSADGKTLPGALDIEYNPYGAECYGLTQSQMVTWIKNFVNEYASREHVYPVIYTTTDWWTSCTGNNGGFAADSPLWVANYTASAGGPLPSGWGYYTIWQYADSGSLPGDQDVFNGAYSQLQTLATRG